MNFAIHKTQLNDRPRMMDGMTMLRATFHLCPSCKKLARVTVLEGGFACECGMLVVDVVPEKPKAAIGYRR